MSRAEQATMPLAVEPKVRAQAATSKLFWNGLIWLLLIGGSFIMLLPFVWLVISSVKPQEQIFIFPPEWIPREFRWQNYVEALVYKPFYRFILNTLFIAVANQVAILMTASFCGYGFARIPFPGRELLVWHCAGDPHGALHCVAGAPVYYLYQVGLDRHLFAVNRPLLLWRWRL